MSTTRKPTAAKPARETLEQRLSAVERVTTRLDKATATLRRNHRETGKRLDHLEQLVQEMPEKLAEKVAERVRQETNAQTSLLKSEIAQSETRQADRVTEVARQWPVTAIVIATIAGSAVTGGVLDLLLAAAHLPHL